MKGAVVEMCTNKVEPLSIPQAVADAAAYDARVAAYACCDIPDTDAREWADLPVDPEVGIEMLASGLSPKDVNSLAHCTN